MSSRYNNGPSNRDLGEAFEDRDEGDANPHDASLQSPADRRSATKESVNWVRTALREIRQDMQELKDEVPATTLSVNELTAKFNSATPGGDYVRHLNDHIKIQRDNEEREAAETDNRKYWIGVYRTGLKAVIIAVLLAVGGILLLGIQAQFKIWTGEVHEGKVTIEVPKK